VDAVIGGQCLTQQPDRDLRYNHRVGRVDATLRKRSRVCGLARVRHFQRLRGEHLGEKQVTRPWMGHQRAMKVVEDTLLDHDDLAAATLFGRRANDADLHAELVGHRGERDPGADRRSRDDVMAARVAHFGQRVVLGDDRDIERPWPVSPDERRLKSSDVALDCEPGLLEPFDQPAGRGASPGS